MLEVYPGTKLSTLEEMFDFVSCATSEPVLFNIESKINPEVNNQTRSPQDFVSAMAKVFVSKNMVDRVTHQSFDVSYQSSKQASLADMTVACSHPVQAAVPYPPYRRSL